MVSPLRRHGQVVVIALVGTVLSVAIWQFARRQQAQRLHAGFLSRAQTQSAVAAQYLRSYDEMVHSLSDAFLGQSFVTREEFALVTHSLLQRHPGVQALEWVRIVPEAARAAWEEETSREVGHPVKIWQRRPDGSTHIAPPDAEYFAITYVEPRANNESVLGYDVRTAPSAPMLAAARTDGKFRASPILPLAQTTDPTAGPGVLFILPFQRPTKSGPVTEGFIQGVFYVQTMLAQSHRLVTNEALDTYYVEVGADGTPTVLYANFAGVEPLREPGRIVAAPPLDRPGDFHFTLRVGGREWLMVVQQNANWTAANTSSEAILILLAGLTITGLLAFSAHNLTERTRQIASEVAERTRQLRASEARLQAIMDHSPAIIFLKDLEGRYLLCNQAFADFCCRPATEIIGRVDEDLFTAADAAAVRHNDERVVAAGRPIEFEETCSAPANGRIYLAHKFPLLDDRGQAYALCGISTDITERKTAEANKLALERQLLESQKLESLGVLAGGIAHDFNNILTTIMGNASLAGMELPDTHPIKRQIQQIEKAARRAADLCAQLLAYAGKASFVNAPVNLSSVVRDIGGLLEVSVGKRVRLELRTATDLPAVVGDTTQLRQIVMNLVINAADAIGERADGVIIVRTYSERLPAEIFARAVQSPALKAGRYVGLEVTDNGAGMAPEVLPRIFEPFFTTKFSGRGLGLAAVLGIVHRHGGALFVDSVPGQGTTFRMLLPAGEGEAPNSTSPFARATGPLQGTVLVVDDEEEVRAVTVHALRKSGLSVLEAGDGLAALEIVRNWHRDLRIVLLDLMMPGMPGEETLRQMRTIAPTLPVIVISGYSAQETMDRCRSLGVSDCVAKPYDVNALVGKIRRHLA